MRKLTRNNVFLGVLMLGIALLAVLLGRDLSRPNVEFLPEMKYSPAYGAYDSNPNFPNGRTLQEPVAGTIARGERPLHYTATKEEALRAGEELRNPLTAPPAELRRSVQRGAEVYRISCAVCHGAGGQGDGPVTKRGFPPPPSLLLGKSLQMKDGQLFHILTYGQGGMSSFAGQLAPRRRWDVINYVRQLQRQHAEEESRKKERPQAKPKT